ncbi:MAG: hypothetical protein LBB88_01915 [Planctomycetaceae bacterium]|jgi:hypothetical protein|nr:hypothetical protein [Planctomycetaceae bacterium]
MKKFLGLFWTALLLVVVGCGNGNVSLNGRVTFSDDGSPVTAGTVCFVKDTFQATGKLNSSGYYVVGTMKSTDGIPAGVYKVYIADAKKQIGTQKVQQVETDGSTKEVDEPIYEILVDKKFSSSETSGLTFEVKGDSSFDFKVDRFKP